MADSQQPMPQPEPAETRDNMPGVGEMVFHPVHTFQYVLTLLGDRRVPVLRKALFVAPLVVLALALLAPETVIGAVVGTALPVLGEVLSLPVDASLDWVTLAILAFALLRVFPGPILSEHHQRLFHHRGE